MILNCLSLIKYISVTFQTIIASSIKEIPTQRSIRTEEPDGYSGYMGYADGCIRDKGSGSKKNFIKQVNEIISDIHFKLTGGKERISISYEASNGNMSLEEALKRYRERDMRMKSTTVGPHRDDICFTTDSGLDVRKFGSQGQQRTAALSLKMSEIELVKQVIKDTPVLLLDDVLSELGQTSAKLFIGQY